ncbi:uncharacterized protein LOC113672087 [Pocillopora damicornis]|uniref:uncharacterized protein LOC113672087 n=1 Tax=Pocillopora damicornis TaxID=46731 RepID=UPI000F54E78E|nr:uncharacterized protein LOC113672087 [Pocillopora damicornis]
MLILVNTPEVSLMNDTAAWLVIQAANMAEGGKRQPSSLCFCSAKKTVHVHCCCSSCNGKPVNYRTQISHLEFERNLEASNAVSVADYQFTGLQEETVSLQCGASTNLATEEVEDEDATENFEQICSPQHQNLSDVEDVDPPPMDFEGVDNIGDDGNGINGDDNGGTAPGTEDQKLKYAIVK